MIKYLCQCSCFSNYSIILFFILVWIGIQTSSIHCDPLIFLKFLLVCSYLPHPCLALFLSILMFIEEIRLIFLLDFPSLAFAYCGSVWCHFIRSSVPVISCKLEVRSSTWIDILWSMSQIQPLLLFVNKILLEHSMPVCLVLAYGCSLCCNSRVE